MEDTPSYPSPCNIGDEVTVSGTLCVTNSVGGTTILEHDGTVTVKVTKAFWDYETGWRFHGKVAPGPVVDEFRRQATSRYTAEDYRRMYPGNPELATTAEKAAHDFDPSKLYFSEHDIVRAPSARPM